MRTMPCPLYRIRQKRQRELHLGSRRAGHDARLRGHDDALCPVYLLRSRIHFSHCVRAPDIHQDEHRRGRHIQVYCLAPRCVPVHYQRVDRVPGIFRLPHIVL